MWRQRTWDVFEGTETCLRSLVRKAFVTACHIVHRATTHHAYICYSSHNAIRASRGTGPTLLTMPGLRCFHELRAHTAMLIGWEYCHWSPSQGGSRGSV